MKYSSNLYLKIDEVEKMLTEMINLAELQKAQNFEHLYSLQKGLKELAVAVGKEETLDVFFIKKWNNIMGWVHRAFEDHPILPLIYEIDSEIIPENLRFI